MYRNILVPLDGSTFSEHVLPLALALARKTGASLRLVSVHTPVAAVYLEGVGMMDETLEEHLRKEQRKYLEGVKARIAEAAPDVASTTTAVLDGPVAATVAEDATKEGADLVAMTTHGRGALGRFWLGSVADELVRMLPMPLLLMRPGEGAPDLKKQEAPKHLMLPLDGSPLAEKMIGRTLELAEMLGARVTLSRAIQPVMPLTYHPEGMMIDQPAQIMIDRIETLQSNLRKEALDYLEGVAQRFRAKGIRAEVDVPVEAQPAKAILHEAQARGCDLITLETHGRHGLKRLILGSVADKVIRAAPIPVLVHRPAS